MKAETEVNLEIAVEESHKKKTKKHHKKQKHLKKQPKAQKKFLHNKAKKVNADLEDEDTEDDLDEDPIVEYVPEVDDADEVDSDDEVRPTGAISADDIGDNHAKKSSFKHQKKAHHPVSNKNSHHGLKKGAHAPASHKKMKHSSAHPVKSTHDEEDPFATFEESLTNHQGHHPTHEAVEKPHKLQKKKLSHAQKKHGHKHHTRAHTDSVPACTSLGCKTDSAAKPPADPWPKDYPVANWGADHDMATTAKNTADAEAKLGAWNPQQDENGHYVVPHADAEFKLTGTKSDIRMSSKSDPICSSAGCT